MAYLSTRTGPSTIAPADGSRTIIITDSNPRELGESNDDAGGRSGGSGERIDGVLHLRGARSTRPSVRWTETTVDNEGMGKKKSKICCIYRRPRNFNESSSEESSSDSSDADSDSDGSGPDPDRAQPGGRLARRTHSHRHHHPHSHGDGSSNGRGDGSGTGEGIRDVSGAVEVHECDSDDEDVNAYERLPNKSKGKGKSGQ